MKLVKKLLPFNNKKIRVNKSRKFNSSFFYWLIPIVFFSLAVLLLAAYVLNFKVKTASPAQIININEPFSGKLYFNNDFNKTEFSDVIISAIDKSKTKIDVAVYSMDHKLIRDALIRAANRGVKVTLILSDKLIDKHNRVFADLPKNIERLDIKAVGGSGFSNGLMHNKFLIIDQGTKDERMFFGAYNFTELQEKYDPSFLMQTTRPEIIKVFAEEFARIYGLAKGERKPDVKFNPFAALINYSDGYLEIWFCPQLSSAGLRERLLDLIKNAESQIEILIWNLTDKGVTQELGKQALNKLSIKILVDDINFLNQDSAFPYLLVEKNFKDLKNLEILTDAKRNQEIKEKFNGGDFNSYLHHHLLLVDNKIALFGTNNWSTNGFSNNNESAMVTNIPSIFSAFKNTFDINYTKAK